MAGYLNLHKPLPSCHKHSGSLFSFKEDCASRESVYFRGCLFPWQNDGVCCFGISDYQLALKYSGNCKFSSKIYEQALGLILILTGLFLLDVLKIKIPGLSISEKYQGRLADSGILGSLLLGFIFALSFCPVSAGLFFGSLIPLALNNSFGASLPFIYGIGTGLPVLVFVSAIALGVTSLSRWFNWLAKSEIYIRRVTGIIFIIVGFYYVFVYLLKFYSRH